MLTILPNDIRNRKKIELMLLQWNLNRRLTGTKRQSVLSQGITSPTKVYEERLAGPHERRRMLFWSVVLNFLSAKSNTLHSYNLIVHYILVQLKSDATYNFRRVLYSNYGAISHGNPVFQPMTWIWPFKVTKSQTHNAIRFATHDLLL